jgi:hypothetical protein
MIYKSNVVISTIGLTRSESLEVFSILGKFKSKSVEVIQDSGYADITWTYNDSIKSAIGIFNYPLYNNARFKLRATNQVKTPDNIAIINPQDRDYIT